MSLPYEIILIFLTYLWASIPFGYIITKLSTGKNILELGSGNVGSTNVRRIAGKKMSVITQFLDMLKGLLPVALLLYFTQIEVVTSSPNFIFLLAFATVIGHNFSIFLKFEGGKGVNTTLGASLLLAPYSVFISVLMYFMVKWRFKFVSLSSIILAISLPMVELIFHYMTSTFYYLLTCSVLIIIMHRKNIQRLIKGNELRS